VIGSIPRKHGSEHLGREMESSLSGAEAAPLMRPMALGRSIVETGLRFQEEEAGTWLQS
jgi:hypothetical protein